MALADRITRWLRDKTQKDEHISVHPGIALRDAEAILEQLSAPERKARIEHIRAYSTSYFQGRHNQEVPQELKNDLVRVEKRVERLAVVDEARAIVAKHGGPPTYQTLVDSLERSQKYFEKVKEVTAHVAVTPIAKSKGNQKEHTMEASI